MSNLLAKQIKELLDIKTVLEYYGIQFNNRGFAKCPFHNEKTASLSIKGKYFRCFGCGESGGSIDFVMKYFTLNLGQALLKLNADFNLNLSREKPSHRMRLVQAENKRISKAYEKWQARLHEKYLFVCSIHAILFRQLCKEPSNQELAEYILKLDEWLDQNIEEVHFG